MPADMPLKTRQPTSGATAKSAVLYRMAMPGHLCPYVLKSRYLLEQQGFTIDDHLLKTRDETDAFMAEHGVETTPQTWVNGRRIGGYDDLRAHFGKTAQGTSYGPVLMLFGLAALMALAISHVSAVGIGLRTFEWFISVSMVLLAAQKLRDVESFSTMFLNYDLLARRWVPYGYIYPYGEALAGILMTAGALIWLAAPLAIVIGGIGAVSVIKAVYVDKRDLKCACMGGESNVPLGAISLTENLMMLAMGIWMPFKVLFLS